VLLSKKDGCSYQFFIEPKGAHLQLRDRWKEDFLSKIENNHKAMSGVCHTTSYSNKEYKIIGLKFYNHDNFCQFFEHFKLLLIKTRHIYAMTKKHWLG
jgi:type III restriction enzyme